MGRGDKFMESSFTNPACATGVSALDYDIAVGRAKKVPLSRGYEAVVDADDYERVMMRKWHASGQPHNLSVVTNHKIGERKTSIQLGRFILGVTDHKILITFLNNNPLDCRRSNMHVGEKGIVMRHRGKWKVPCSSQYKGVSWFKAGRKWRADILINGKKKHLGWFTDEKQAAIAYDKAAYEAHGDLAFQNFDYGKKELA